MPSRDGGGGDSLYGHPSAGGGRWGVEEGWGQELRGGGVKGGKAEPPHPPPPRGPACVFPNNQLVANNWHLSCKVGCGFATKPEHLCVNAFAAPFTTVGRWEDKIKQTIATATPVYTKDGGCEYLRLMK